MTGGDLARTVDQDYGWRRIPYRPLPVLPGWGWPWYPPVFPRPLANLSEALTAGGLIVPRTDGSKRAAGKIIILDGAAAGRTISGLVDERIASSVAAVRVGAGLKEQGCQHEQH